MTNTTNNEANTVKNPVQGIEETKEKLNFLRSYAAKLEKARDFALSIGLDHDAADYDSELKDTQQQIADFTAQLDQLMMTDKLARPIEEKEGENSNPFRQYIEQLEQHLQKDEKFKCAEVVADLVMDALERSSLDKSYSHWLCRLLAVNLGHVMTNPAAFGWEHKGGIN